MNTAVKTDPELKALLDRMTGAKQLSAADAAILLDQKAGAAAKTEEDVLRWLAKEYHLGFTTLDDIDPDRELLSLFPARILSKEELLPLHASTAPSRSPPAGSSPPRAWTPSRP